MRRTRGIAKNHHSGERLCDCGCRKVENCGCWRFPAELFLVSHAVCAMAMEIFYGKNHFIICQQEMGSTNIDSHFHCLDKLPPLGLKLLRKVELRHSFGHGMINKRIDHETNWKRLGQVIEQRMTPSQLHLIIESSRLISFYLYSQDQDLKMDLLEDLTHSHYDGMAKSFKDIGLAKLHIYFVRSKPDKTRYRLSITQRQLEMEQKLEQCAMGQDYDGLNEGKYTLLAIEDGNNYYVRPKSRCAVEEAICASHSTLGQFEWKGEA